MHCAEGTVCAVKVAVAPRITGEVIEVICRYSPAGGVGVGKGVIDAVGGGAGIGFGVGIDVEGGAGGGEGRGAGVVAGGVGVGTEGGGGVGEAGGGGGGGIGTDTGGGGDIGTAAGVEEDVGDTAGTGIEGAGCISGEVTGTEEGKAGAITGAEGEGGICTAFGGQAQALNTEVTSNNDNANIFFIDRIHHSLDDFAPLYLLP